MKHIWGGQFINDSPLMLAVAADRTEVAGFSRHSALTAAPPQWHFNPHESNDSLYQQRLCSQYTLESYWSFIHFSLNVIKHFPWIYLSIHTLINIFAEVLYFIYKATYLPKVSYRALLVYSNGKSHLYPSSNSGGNTAWDLGGRLREQRAKIILAFAKKTSHNQ